jgi:uncharacterized protein (DUF983 family)
MIKTLLVRAMRLRCPWCGERDAFVHRLRVRPRCPDCGFRFDREEGAWLISITINYGITGAVWILGFVIALVVFLPDLPVVALVVRSVIQIVVTAIVFYPYSKTISACLDVFVHTSRGELVEGMSERFGVSESTPR